MSRHSIHTTSIYSTYNQSSNAQLSRNSTYTPVTNHYNQPHVSKSVSPADTNPDDIDLNHPANWGIFDDPSQPPRRPKWERKPSAAPQSYPVTRYDPPRQPVPTASGTDGPLPQGSYTYAAHGAPFVAGNAFSANTQPPNQGSPAPYVGGMPSAAPTSVPPQRSSTHASPSRVPARTSAEPRPLSPSQWHDPSSQAPRMEASSAEPRDKDRHRQENLLGSRSWTTWGRGRARLLDRRGQGLRVVTPLPDAKVRATIQGDPSGGSKGKGKADLSLEEEKLREKRRKEADRVQTYRDTIDGAYDELHAALYPDEEKCASIRSDHSKRKCMQDVAKMLKDAARTEAALHSRIRKLEEFGRKRVAEVEALRATINAHSQMV